VTGLRGSDCAVLQMIVRFDLPGTVLELQSKTRYPELRHASLRFCVSAGTVAD